MSHNTRILHPTKQSFNNNSKLIIQTHHSTITRSNHGKERGAASLTYCDKELASLKLLCRRRRAVKLRDCAGRRDRRWRSEDGRLVGNGEDSVDGVSKASVKIWIGELKPSSQREQGKREQGWRGEDGRRQRREGGWTASTA